MIGVPPFFQSATSGLSSFVCEDNQLVPGLSGCGQVATLLADACRLAVMPFSFIPLPLLVVDPAELMPGGRLHLGLVELLKESQRRLLTRPRLLQLSFRQRERAEPAQVYTLAPEVVQFLGNLEGRFVCLPRVAVVATGAKRIAELRTQRAPQAFDVRRSARACR